MSINLAIDTEQTEKDRAEIITLCKSKSVIITDQPELEDAAEFLKIVKAHYKALETKRKAITGPIDEAKKLVMDLFREPLTLLENTEATIKRAIANYQEAQEKKAREEQAALQRLADKEAERQKKLLDAKIERAEASGKTEKIEELLQQKENIIPVAAPIISPSFEAPKGISYKDKWSATVIDASLVPREWMIPNIDALNKFAAATKGSAPVPGVKFTVEKIISSRS